MSRATAAPDRVAGADRSATRSRPRRAAVWFALGIVAVVTINVALGASAYPLIGAAVNLALAVLFGATLRRGHEPMITVFARAERGALEPDLVAYTRSLTRLWVAFFVVAAVVCAAFVRSATPLSAAALAVGNWLAVAVLFVGEWVYRRARFRHYEHASPLALFRIVVACWWQGTQR